MTRLFLMCGLPGAGKTTLARRLERQFAAIRLCPDEWMAALEVDLFDEAFRDRLERLHWAQAKDLLRIGTSVIIESGLWLRAERDERRLGARALGVEVELHYLPVPLEERVRRVLARNLNLPWGTVSLSEETLRGYDKYFQPPDATELALYDPPLSGACSPSPPGG